MHTLAPSVHTSAEVFANIIRAASGMKRWGGEGGREGRRPNEVECNEVNPGSFISVLLCVCCVYIYEKFFVIL